MGGWRKAVGGGLDDEDTEAEAGAEGAGFLAEDAKEDTLSEVSDD